MASVSVSPIRGALALTLLAGALRWHLAGLVGFGDAEALYASYALHPAPAYLDHPGLVGVMARLIGGGGAPSPVAAHRFTALAATAMPWVGFLAARAAGAPAASAFRAFFALALLPEATIGLFGLTPDLPLTLAWLCALGSAAFALRSAPGSFRALSGILGAALLAGLAVHSKASGALLALSLGAVFVLRSGRAHAKTPAPYLGVALFALLVSPLVLWEVHEGFPLLRHRLVATQSASGFSLRNLGALVGGQLLYVTPPFLVGAYRVLRRTAARTSDAVDGLLFLAAVVPAAPLALLCLWSRVAEPHWLAPAYLSLALAAARRESLGARLERTSVAIGVLAVLVGWAAVATPLVPTVSGKRYEPRYDLVNDLFAWRTGLPLVTEELGEAARQSASPVIVGPHWIVCAQVHAALGANVPVGCQTPGGDDFARWYPESSWRRTRTLIYVTDDRFPAEPARAFPDRDVVSIRQVHVYRAGRSVRTIRVSRLELSAAARRLDVTPPQWPPAQ